MVKVDIATEFQTFTQEQQVMWEEFKEALTDEEYSEIGDSIINITNLSLELESMGVYSKSLDEQIQKAYEPLLRIQGYLGVESAQWFEVLSEQLGLKKKYVDMMSKWNIEI
jgi:hypothetical protein